MILTVNILEMREAVKASSDKGKAIRTAVSASRIYQICLIILSMTLWTSIIFIAKY